MRSLGRPRKAGRTVREMTTSAQGRFLAQSRPSTSRRWSASRKDIRELAGLSCGADEDRRHLTQDASLDARIGFIRDDFDVIRSCANSFRDDRGSMRAAPPMLSIVSPARRMYGRIPWVHFSDTGVDDVDLAPQTERRLCEEHGDCCWSRLPDGKAALVHRSAAGQTCVLPLVDLSSGAWRSLPAGTAASYQDYVVPSTEREPYESYLAAFRYGMPPDGGFALGSNGGRRR